MKKNRKILIWITIIAVVTVACSCPLVDTIADRLKPAPLKTAEGMIDEFSSALTEMPVEELIEAAEELATEMPIEEMVKTAEALSTEMPLEDMAKTAEALGTQMPLDELPIPDLDEFPFPDGGDDDEENVPTDIPLLPGPKEDLTASEEFVSYASLIPYTGAVDFYKKEMPARDWTPNIDNSIEVGDVATLVFEKPERDANVIITVDNEMTSVQIFIIKK